MVTVRRPRITFLLPDALKKLTTIKMNSEPGMEKPPARHPAGAGQVFEESRPGGRGEILKRKSSHRLTPKHTEMNLELEIGN